MAGKKVVLVSTSAHKLGEHETGLWLDEIADPYYAFQKAGYDIEIASIKGGAVPIDAGSMADAFFGAESKKFMHDGKAIGQLMHSKEISTVDLSDVDVLFMCGGHGTSVDFYNSPNLTKAIETQFNAKKIVASVCHGPTCLVDPIKSDGTPIVLGMKVTGFSNSEEKAVGLEKAVPFLLEDRLKKLGGFYSAGADWTSHVIVDSNLITGQNPQSALATAEACIKALN